MKESQGKDEPFYPLFADFAEQSVLIAGVMVAEKLGQREDSGRLRLNARDLALQNSKDALFLTSFAAWDVENRYPLRAQDMVHKYSVTFQHLRWLVTHWEPYKFAWDAQQEYRELQIEGIRIAPLWYMNYNRDVLEDNAYEKILDA